MHYKTIVLELLEQHPALKQHLQMQRRMLTTLEHLACELKLRHEQLTAVLQQNQPVAESNGASSQAMEMAISELQERLTPLSDDSVPDTAALDQLTELLNQPSQPD